ncbi:MAG: FAD:protein FMN transferase [Anaerolineae bacterium]
MYHEHHFRAMNTDVGAWVWSDDARSAQRALAKVERLFRAAHTRFTRFDASSELSALNASNGRPFAASRDMFEVVKAAIEFSARTHGLFNPTIIGALEAAGYDRSFEAIGSGNNRSVVSGSPISSMASIKLDAAAQTITLPIGVRLDLGGIVKGWTVQQAGQQLAYAGPCLVDAGGDMWTSGLVPSTAHWTVNVMDPFDHDRDVMTLRLHDCGVATSGIDRRQWQHHGEQQHHLIDPRTGHPSTSDLWTATVIAPTTIEAEIMAKTVFLLGSIEGLEFVNERPQLAACVITANGEVLLSNRMQEYLDVVFTYSDHPGA